MPRGPAINNGAGARAAAGVTPAARRGAALPPARDIRRFSAAIYQTRARLFPINRKVKCFGRRNSKR
jgi:hypothetical protein